MEWQDRTGLGVAWRGVAWRGVAWRGVAWRGVAWRGVACFMTFGKKKDMSIGAIYMRPD